MPDSARSIATTVDRVLSPGPKLANTAFSTASIPATGAAIKVTAAQVFALNPFDVLRIIRADVDVAEVTTVGNLSIQTARMIVTALSGALLMILPLTSPGTGFAGATVRNANALSLFSAIDIQEDDFRMRGASGGYTLQIEVVLTNNDGVNPHSVLVTLLTLAQILR